MFGNGLRLGSGPMAHFIKELAGESTFQITHNEAINDCDILSLSKCCNPRRGVSAV